MARPWIRRMSSPDLLYRIEAQEDAVGSIVTHHAMGECHVGEPYELPDYHTEMIAEAQSRGLLPNTTVPASQPEGETK